jgi:hypothetical protein
MIIGICIVAVVLLNVFYGFSGLIFQITLENGHNYYSQINTDINLFKFTKL